MCSLNIGKNIQKAKQLLEAGELVAIPTETVYGLAANGLSADAVLKIYKAKNRPSFNPLILHVPYLGEAKKLVKYFPEKALQLAETFWPGPLTLVLPKNDIVPDIVTAGQSTVAIRVPNHPLTLQLLRALDFPLAAPSANSSGYISPTSVIHVQQQLGEKIAYVLDGGECSVGVESTIVKVTEDEVSILRYGGISVEDIIDIIGEVNLPGENNIRPEAPGMLTSHYAPTAPLIVANIELAIQQYSNKKIGVLSFQKKYETENVIMNLVLSPQGNVDVAAKNIFAYLHQLDAQSLDIIIAEFVPNEGLGKAVNDKLKRASAER